MPNRYLSGIARLGGYETAERAAVRRFLPRDLPLIELGVGIGVVACLANRRLRRPHHHVCVDGNPRALQQAVAHRGRNGCGFSTHHAAIAYDAATVSFGMDEGIVSGGIESHHEQIEVPTITLETLLDRAQFRSASLICDIEGQEKDLLAREGTVLRDRVPWLMLETHPQVYGSVDEIAILRLLAELGYRHWWGRGDVRVWKR